MEVFKMIIPVFNFENMSVFNKEYIFSNEGWPSKEDAIKVISEDNGDRNGFPLVGDEGKEESEFVKKYAIRFVEDLAEHEWPSNQENKGVEKERKIKLSDGTEVDEAESVMFGHVVYKDGFLPQLFYISKFKEETKICYFL